uniref:ShKT domain-containing protein n=1 Tax=Magallana gigas TaxID=29159 RepID=A0A8W8L5A2_MAGGI|nr:integumentary mucin A.1 isoform X1 [Crassostrea gigas]
MFVVVLLSLVGTSFTSSLSYRAGHHSALINCPTCEHHICDVNSLMQCEVCQIAIPHKDQPPQNVKCAQAGHCHEDHHNFCCDNEGCVESIFGQLGSTAVLNPTAASTIECPSCEKGNCDFINRDQCFMCKFDLHDGQLPHVHCLKENEHCDPTHHNTLCCSDEQCIAQAFGQYYPTSYSVTSTTTAATTDTPTTSTASSTINSTNDAPTTPTASATATTPTSDVPTTSTVSFVTTAPPTTPDSSSVSSTITDVNISTDSVSSTSSFDTAATNLYTASTISDLNQSSALPPFNTTASTLFTTSQGQGNCTDDINNCEIWLSYGVCHALQEQTSMYALALQCKATCQLCADSH